MCITITSFYDDAVPNQEVSILGMMKIKLMPILASAAVLSVVIAPFAVKANSIYSGKSLVAQAERQPRKHQGLWSKLNLTDQQKQQLRDIKKETRERIKNEVLTSEQQAQLEAAKQQNTQGQNHTNRRGLWKSLNLSDDQKAKMKKIRQEQKAKMDAVLNDQQRQQVEQMRSEWKQRHQQRQNNQ